MDYHFFEPLDNFLQRKCLWDQQDAENAFQELVDSGSLGFHGRRTNLLPIAKKAMILIVPAWMTKDMFRPSYSDSDHSLECLPFLLHQPAFLL